MWLLGRAASEPSELAFHEAPARLDGIEIRRVRGKKGSRAPTACGAPTDASVRTDPSTRPSNAGAVR